MVDQSLPGSDDGGGREITRGVAVAAAVLVAVALAIGWYFRPWFQGLVYLLYTTPMVLVAGAVAAAVTATLWRRDFPLTANAALGIFVVVLVAGTGAAGLFAGEELGTSTMADSEVTGGLSEVDPDRPRVVTKSVASRYASNTLNFPQYRISGGDITVYNGTPHWSYALSPDGTWNHLTKQQHGTVLVDMTRQNAQTEVVTGDLRKGIGTAFYNHYKWHTVKNGEYLVDYEDPFMVVHEGEQYVAVPYTKPEFHWTPVPHTTPEWGGVALIDSEGSLEDLSPAEARSHPVLEGQKLYPLSLARQKVAATKYRNGIVNTFTSHRDEIEVAPVPGEDNDQPFVVLTENGPEYVVAVEPYGDAQGLKEVWTVDSRTGDFQRYSPNESLFGPRKATDYVRQAARTTDWNRFTPSEPIPVVVDGEFYWEVRVVPEDSSGIAYIAFVNARSSDVVEVEQTEEVSAFLRGATVAPDAGDGEGSTDGDAPEMIVQRVADNGTVLETLEVYGNESIQIERGARNETDGR
ncbi:ABC transporter permease [Halorussus marinus]|uniref:ABC transporter permease n=1 Tax=Halorussus marinus TaxID=2505976 RepID=UPI001FD70BF2|nr:ABC transporter permease [Halorussus marinus]